MIRSFLHWQYSKNILTLLKNINASTNTSLLMSFKISHLHKQNYYKSCAEHSKILWRLATLIKLFVHRQPPFSNSSDTEIVAVRGGPTSSLRIFAQRKRSLTWQTQYATSRSGLTQMIDVRSPFAG